MPAPGSTATSAPSAISFLTVSGVAATRGSSGSVSAAIAIFMTPPEDKEDHYGRTGQRPRMPLGGPRSCGSGQEIGHKAEDQHDDDEVPLQQFDEQFVGTLVRVVIIARGGRVFDHAVVGHRDSPLLLCSRN